MFILCPLSNEIFQWRDLVVADGALGEGDGEGELVEGEGLVLEAKVDRFYIDRCYVMIGGGRGREEREGEEGGGRGEMGEGRGEGEGGLEGESKPSSSLLPCALGMAWRVLLNSDLF